MTRLSSFRGLGGLRLLVPCLSIAAALVAASGASALPQRFDMGVYDPASNQLGGGSDYATLDEGLAMQRTRQAGSRLVRIPVSWERIVCSDRQSACTQQHRPDSPSDYHWTRPGWYDHTAEIAEARSRGLEPILTVFHAPSYAECNGNGSRAQGTFRLVCPNGTRPEEANYLPSPADFGQFMRALSQRYPGVRYFQVWNEPNFSVFLKPALDPATIGRYRQLVNAAFTAINNLDPDDVVIAGGTSPNPRSTGSIKAFSPKYFLRRLVSRQVRFDVYDHHPYTQGGPRTRAPKGFGAIWMGDLWQLNRILKRAKADRRILGGPLRFWAAEFGWDSAPPDCRVGYNPAWGGTFRSVPAGLLTRWVSESAYRMWRQGVSAMVWGQLKDFPIRLNPHQGGLYRWGGNHEVGRAKGAVRSFQFPFVAFRRDGGAYVWGRLPVWLPPARRDEVAIQKRVGSSWRRVRAIRTLGSAGLFSRRLSFSLRNVNAMRARVPGGMYSAAFRLRAPRVPAAIRPFGCTRLDQFR